MATNIFREILVWSKELAPWQNEAIRRLFLKGALSTEDNAALFEYAQIEHGLLPNPAATMDLTLKASDLPTPPGPGQKIKLLGLGDLQNVNALKANGHLGIGDQLTIIYGDNGSGKSGYARVMKKAFRARAVDEILPNVYSETRSKSPASATFEFEENGKCRKETWIDGTETAECFGRFAVFDGKCARVYINENNQLSFLPFGFDIIDGLGKATAEIKQRLQDLGIQTTPKIDAIKPLLDETPTGKFLSSINANTKPSEISSKATWTLSDDTNLLAKEQDLAKLRISTPASLRAALTAKRSQIVTVRDGLNATSKGISDEKLEKVKKEVQDLKKFEHAVEIAAKGAFGNLELTGIGAEVWRELLVAAAKYSMEVAFPGQAFPANGPDGKCVLCLQPLTAVAQERLNRFWAFIQDDASSKRDVAKVTLNASLEELNKLPRTLPREMQILEDALRAAGSRVFEPVKQYYALARTRIVAMETAVAANAWDALPSAPVAPVDICAEELSAIEKELGKVVDDAKLSQTSKHLANEVSELNARKRLNQHLPLVLGHLTGVTSSAKASAAAAKITTNGISLKAAELQKTFVTDAFKRRIQEELKPLRLVRVKAGVDKKSERGKVLHKLTIEGAASATPESVFSEGERTAVSLACFLAELGASDDNCGIIFDDPVSSLDHRVREAIVDRLVAETARRQVIIFTHDLVFYRELVAAAERQAVVAHFQNVEALGMIAGIITDVAPWPVQKVGPRIARLEQVLKAAKTAETVGDPLAYRNSFREFYDLLRSTWERGVEELLFNQVVQRLEKEVKTMSLDGVEIDSESVGAVFEGMTRCSSMIEAHDHCVAKGASMPSVGELEVDLNGFKIFRQKQEAKIKNAKGANARFKK